MMPDVAAKRPDLCVQLPFFITTNSLMYGNDGKVPIWLIVDHLQTRLFESRLENEQ